MDKLLKTLIPPENPHNTGNEEQWQGIFNIIGTKLPSDYMRFIQTYGTGGIDNFLWILTPFVKDKNVNFLSRQKEITDAYIQSKTNFPQFYKHNVYPSAGGLLPWAYTDNGDELYWLTEGKLDEWKIVVYESRSPESYTYPLNMMDFLYQIITRQLVCDAFPDDFPSDVPEFVPVDVGWEL
ncbi:SMI1/KNR4 family protein [Paenibacillus mesophilus]|uniref:SMI1/KNR4 family protein n=1 Tax=Paenibacillus mesophilus TaxID=2582849 RepID=UPI00110E7B22|nr:SMI1/KNR4 family protein [Paenibacillus mesophilus]TMV50637.1 SMI1/KNR4 family protein [Paenibacillus mesophilus]